MRHESDRRKVVFVGFDAGNPTLVRDLVAQGHLPNFARVLAEGASVTVDHEPGVYVGSIWPTTLTGRGVDRHGFYTGTRPVAHGYTNVREGVLAPPFWAEVADAGRRIAVVDPPFFHAVEGLDGLQLLEWGCHDRFYGPHSEPPELLDEVVRAVGRHPIGMIDDFGDPRFAPCDWLDLDAEGRRGPDEVRAFVDTLTDAVDHRLCLTKHLLDHRPFGLVVDIVGETHCAGHHLWSLHDVDHPDHDGELVRRLGGDPLLDVYRSMDRYLGIHLDALDDDAVLYLFLSHGMQAHFDGTHLLDELLWRLDLAYRGQSMPGVGATTARVSRALDHLPDAARPFATRVASQLLRGRYGASAFASADVEPIPDPAARSWRPLDNNTVSGAVRFNQVGREPQGVLGTGMVQHAAAWIGRELRKLVNLDTGAPVVEDVYLASDHYVRHDDDGLPDLFLEWNRDAPIERIWSPTIGPITVPYEGIRTGDHDARGELVAFGPDVTPGSIGAARPVEIAPTVAAAAGVFLTDVDGQPLAGLLPGADRAALDARRTSQTLRRVPAPSVIGADDEPAALRRDLIDLQRRLEGLASAHHDTRRLAVEGRTALEVLATSRWIRGEQVPDDLRISVVMPTRDRVDLLARAVESVLDQSHAALELVVVDDASTDGTAAWLAGVEDDRLVVTRHDVHRGEGASRNTALDLVSGDVVTFLDDDNTFDRDWLRSVVWLFDRQPDTVVAYGARLIDDVDRHLGGEGGGLPDLQLNRWDRALNAERCLVDVNVLAHRPSGHRFDPELPLFTDWDYLLGLTRHVDPVALPVVATHYTTSAPDRASRVDRDVHDELYERVRSRWADG